MSSRNPQLQREIAARVWKLALARGMGTKRDIAAFLERDRSHVGRLLEGEARWTTKMLHHVAAKFGVPVARLTGEAAASGRQVATYQTGPGSQWEVAEESPTYRAVLPPPECLQAFVVRGNSVRPVAHDGDLVLARTDTEPAGGDLAHVELRDGTAMFKRVFQQEGRWLLVPVSPRYPARSVPPREVVHASKVCGVIFGGAE